MSDNDHPLASWIRGEKAGWPRAASAHEGAVKTSEPNMKLPLITRLLDDPKSLFHVLAFDGPLATGVDETTLRIKQLHFSRLSVLSEEDYKKYKAERNGI